MNKNHSKYTKDLPRKLYTFFLNYDGIGAPSFSKFARSIGITVAELEGYRRSNALLSLGYTAEEYERYLSGEKMPKKAEKALRRVKKIKSAPLNAADLISQERTGKGELRNPDSSRIFRMLISLIPSTVCMLFTISVMISLKQNMSAASVIEAILKISTLPVIDLKGYSGGYEYATRDEKEWIEAKASLLESFLKAKQ